jgi:hypothetical protein
MHLEGHLIFKLQQYSDENLEGISLRQRTRRNITRHFYLTQYWKSKPKQLGKKKKSISLK